MEDNSETNEQRKREEYVDERRFWYERLHIESQSQDKFVLTLASSAIGLLLVFLKDFGTLLSSFPLLKYLFVIAFFVFLSSLTISLISYSLSKKIITDFILVLDLRIDEKDTIEVDKRIHCRNRINRNLNYFAVSLLVFGGVLIGFIVIFFMGAS